MRGYGKISDPRGGKKKKKGGDRKEMAGKRERERSNEIKHKI